MRARPCSCRESKASSCAAAARLSFRGFIVRKADAQKVIAHILIISPRRADARSGAHFATATALAFTTAIYLRLPGQGRRAVIGSNTFLGRAKRAYDIYIRVLPNISRQKTPATFRITFFIDAASSTSMLSTKCLARLIRRPHSALLISR